MKVCLKESFHFVMDLVEEEEIKVEVVPKKKRVRKLDTCRHSCGCRYHLEPVRSMYIARHEKNENCHPACDSNCSIHQYHIPFFMTRIQELNKTTSSLSFTENDPSLEPWLMLPQPMDDLLD